MKKKRGVGRPDHVPTNSSRKIVEQCLSCGMSHREIAAAIGISWKTLGKYYEEELMTGAARKKQEIIGMLYAAARAGNVSAQRKLYAITHGEKSAKEERRELLRKLGKKEAVQKEADTLTGKFAPPAPPKLVINNT